MGSVREAALLLAVAVLVGGAVALLLPRTRVPVKVKRIIASVWIAVGLLQIFKGIGASMAAFGLSEVVLFGGALLVFTEKRRVRIVGGSVIFLGLVLFAAAGTRMRLP